MKVEHHVTIHSGLNIHAPVFAESMEEAERLGREWALAQFAAANVNESRKALWNKTFRDSCVAGVAARLL